jgi:hypothetical protein
MEASKKSTATPLGGVSPIVKVIGTPLLIVGEPPREELMELPQATRETQHTSASEKRRNRDIRRPPETVSVLDLLWGMKARSASYNTRKDSGKRLSLSVWG